MSQLKRRARQPAQKAERRHDILAEARALLARQGWRDLTMAGLAGRLGLAKGTLYLYFPTKEALFVAVLRQELTAFFEAVDGRLAALGHRGDGRAIASLLSGEAAARPLLRRLLVLLHGVLEENVGLAEVRAFKRFLLERVQASGAALEGALPRLAPGGGPTLLLRLHALVIGAQAMADPAPVVRRALRDEALAVFDVDFEPFLGSTLAALLAGMLRPPAEEKGTP
jgi:AcrR family transcriptional regulator